MSDSTDRTVDTGALSRKPDVSRLVKRNRPTAAAKSTVSFPAAPPPAANSSAADAAVDASLANGAEAAEISNADAPLPPAVVDPAPATPASEEAPKAKKSAEATTAKRTLTVYVGGEVRQRARAAYKATNYEERDATWSDFVEKAIQAETERRERKYNHGKQFEGGAERLRGGRPLKDD